MRKSYNNELLITLSNYGVQSVWYTADGGATWLSKDLPAHGLPDFPVYAALMNPTNRRQVMLATELGVWSTTDITAANPGWILANTNAPLIRTKNLVYRAADEHIALVTAGRGVWETNAWALDPPALMAGPMTTTILCTGSTFPLSFTLTNAPASRIALRLSSATGDFAEGLTIAAIRGVSGVLSATLPATLASGTGYRLRLEASDLNLTTIISNTLTISNLSGEKGSILDRRQMLNNQLADARYVTGYVCPGDSALLRADVLNQTNSPTATYRWAIGGQPIAGQTAATLLTGQTGTYSFTASVGSCTTTNTDDFLLIVTNSPTLSMLNPANAGEGPVCPGTSLLLVSSYLGQRAVYHWFRDGDKLLSTTSLVFSATQTGGYSYSLTVTGTNAAGTGVCTATAPATYLTFSPVILPANIAVVGDAPPTTCGTELLTLYATQQRANTTYQWLLNGHLLTSKTSSFVSVNQGGVYRLQSQRGTCMAVSDPISVSANGVLSNGIYFYGSTTLCAGESLVLYAKNTTHTLQWTKNNVPIDGATGFNYVVTEPGNYGLRYVSGSCSGTSVAVSVVFSQMLTPVLSLAEQCTTVELSTRDLPRTGTASFSWFRNGQPVSQGLQAYQTVTESGLYSVSVTSGVCGGLSAPVSINIGQPAKPVIAAVGGLVSCANSAIALQRISGSYSYWRRNGIRLEGAYSDQLIATQTGVYSLVYAQNTCLTESATVSVVIGQPASATLVSRPFIRSGQSATLPIQLSGDGPWSFSMVGGAAVVNTFQNPYSLTVTPSQTTSYSFVGITNSCGVGPESVLRVFVDGADVSLTGWVNKRFAQPGDSVTYSVRVTNAGPDVAENLIILNRLPTGLSYAGSLSTTADNTLRHMVGNVPVGEFRVFTFGTRINRPGTYLNAVEVITCDTPDPDSQPNTGTTDGEDDAAWVDYRTTDSTGYVASSPNPNGRILPAVTSNQPLAVPTKADLSLSIFLNKRVAQLRDTIRVTMAVHNRGGLSASLVQTGLNLPNGTYSLDRITWKPVVPVLTVEVGQVEPNATISRIVYWLPTTSNACRAEVIRSSVADPDSTPDNRSTRPGEDDEALIDIRVLR